MPVPRIFCPTLSTELVTPPEEEAHHAATVLRLARGDAVEVFDGCGGIAPAVVERAGRREFLLRVGKISRQPFDSIRRLTIAVAAPKAHRQSYLVEKCTELGVAALWALECARSVAFPGVGAVNRWQRRAIEAAKQSRRCWVPTIASASLEMVLGRLHQFAGTGIVHPHGVALPLKEFLGKVPVESSLLILIGPEGGWTDDELQSAGMAGATPVHLGSAILRTETAAVAICAVAALGAVTTSAS